MIDGLAGWIAQHAPAYYGPALAAFAMIFKVTQDIDLAFGRNAARALAFALLLGSKLTIDVAGEASVAPLWHDLLGGPLGFTAIGLGFWAIGGYGLCQLLDALVEVLKIATRTLHRSVLGAVLLLAIGAVGAVATAPLGKMFDTRFAGVPAASATPAPSTQPAAGPTPATTPSIAPTTTTISAPAPAAVPTTAPSPATAPPP